MGLFVLILSLRVDPAHLCVHCSEELGEGWTGSRCCMCAARIHHQCSSDVCGSGFEGPFHCKSCWREMLIAAGEDVSSSEDEAAAEADAEQEQQAAPEPREPLTAATCREGLRVVHAELGEAVVVGVVEMEAEEVNVEWCGAHKQLPPPPHEEMDGGLAGLVCCSCGLVSGQTDHLEATDQLPDGGGGLPGLAVPQDSHGAAATMDG